MLSASPVRLTRDERRAETRRRLLEAAARVFARRGYHAASVDEIAGEAGFTTGALYSNFAGKQDLFLSLLTEHVTLRMAEYARAVAGATSLEGRARAVADSWMDFIDKHPEFFPLFLEMRTLAMRDEELGPRLRAGFDQMRAGTTRLVRDVAAEMGFRLGDEEAREVATAISALGVGLAVERAGDPRSVPRHLFGDTLVALLRSVIDKREKQS